MNYLIISIYDCMRLGVCMNGTIYEDGSEVANRFSDAYYEQNGDDYAEIFAKFMDGYDLVVLCEDGRIEILKGKAK